MRGAARMADALTKDMGAESFEGRMVPAIDACGNMGPDPVGVPTRHAIVVRV